MFGNKLRFKRVEIDGLSEELAGTEIAGATASLIVTVGGHHEPRLIVILSDIKMPGMAGWNCLGRSSSTFPTSR